MKTISTLFFMAFAVVAMGDDLVDDGGHVYPNFKVTGTRAMRTRRVNSGGADTIIVPLARYSH